MQPIYTADNTTPAYQLNWGLTIFWRAAPISEDVWLADLQEVTEPDGVRVLKHQFTTGDASQFFLSTKPHIAPQALLRSVKGRLQHAIAARAPKAFQRNYALRSIGSATRAVVEQYVAEQLGHHRMADPNVQQRLSAFQKTYAGVDLSEPMFSAHGEYWYNLHIVFVTAERWPEIRECLLAKRLATIEAAAAKHGHRLSRASVLPDHVHLTLGCSIDQSPERVALGYLNNAAYASGMKPEFQYSYYAGTIGEYDRGAV